jgi:hypothetical protein
VATIGKVSAVFSASTSGLRAGVSDAIRSFRQLGGEAGTLKGLFESMQGVAAKGVGAVGPAAEVAATKLGQFQRLALLAQQALASGRITAQEFANKLNLIGVAAESAGAAVNAGAALTMKYATAEEGASRSIAEANSLLEQGVISQETHARAMADLTGATAKERQELENAGRAMEMMAQTFNEGAAVTQSVRTAEERHGDEVQRLRGLLAAGAISQETYSRAVDKADDELRQATGGTRGLAAAASAASSGVEKLGGKLNALIAIQAAQLFGQISMAVGNSVRSFVSMGAAQAQVIDGQSDLAKRLGLTYGELAGLGFAGAQVGVSMDSIGKAVTKADVAFVKATQGSKTATAAFAGIGLSVQELEGLSPAERFRAIADGISALPTAAERSRAALQIFGKGAAELLPMFEGGAGAIASATDEAAKFGLALTNDQAASVNSMSDAFDKAQMAVQGIVGQVVAYLAPAIQGVTDTFLNLIGGIGGANIGQFIGEGIMMGAQFLAGIADWMISGIGSAFEYAGTVIDVFNRVVSGLQAIFFVGESVFKGVAALISRVIANGAAIMDALPDSVAGTGWAEFGKSMEDSANKLSTEADAAAGKAVTAAGNVLTGGTGGVGQFQGAGPLSTILADGLAKAKADAAARSVAETGVGQKGQIKPPAEQAFSGASNEALKATDSRSKEGMAEMFRLMRNSGVDIAEQQLEEQRKTNELLSEGDDMEAFGILGA